jgi:hypothetical protein
VRGEAVVPRMVVGEPSSGSEHERCTNTDSSVV